MKTLVISVSTLLLSGVLAGCYDYNDEHTTVREIPRDEAWRTINVNMQYVLPEWDPDIPFPEEPLDPPPSMSGCATGKNSLATGPPWSLRVEGRLIEPDRLEIDAIDAGFTALESRGYAPVAISPDGSPENKRVENDAGYVVLLWIDFEADGRRSYELISSSSCIRFVGDDQYN